LEERVESFAVIRRDHEIREEVFRHAEQERLKNETEIETLKAYIEMMKEETLGLRELIELLVEERTGLRAEVKKFQGEKDNLISEADINLERIGQLEVELNELSTKLAGAELIVVEFRDEIQNLTASNDDRAVNLIEVEGKLQESVIKKDKMGKEMEKALYDIEKAFEVIESLEVEVGRARASTIEAENNLNETLAIIQSMNEEKEEDVGENATESDKQEIDLTVLQQLSPPLEEEESSLSTEMQNGVEEEKNLSTVGSESADLNDSNRIGSTTITNHTKSDPPSMEHDPPVILSPQSTGEILEGADASKIDAYNDIALNGSGLDRTKDLYGTEGAFGLKGSNEKGIKASIPSEEPELPPMSDGKGNGINIAEESRPRAKPFRRIRKTFSKVTGVEGFFSNIQLYLNY